MKYVQALVAFAFAAAIQSAFAAPTITTVMSNLDNPRGLAFGPEGALYVVESGRGGTGPCTILRGLLRCYGATGAVTRLWRGEQERVAVGLPSYADAGPTEVTGPHDIAFLGRGHAYVTVGFGADPVERAGFGAVGAQFGTLIHISASGRWKIAADVSAHEPQENPAGGPIDTNPYGVLAEPGSTVVADAGANALLRVKANGDISTIAAFPSRPERATDAVPTSVVRGSDGAYYVGELTGAPFIEGAARIYRVVPGSDPEIFAEGFKTIIDLAWGADGSLYVLQHATGAMFFGGPGQIIRIAPDGSRSVVVEGLSRPTSLVVDSTGAFYVSNRGIEVLTGEVLRIVP